MGKMKSLLMDYQDYNGYPIEIDEAALYDYQQQCHEEELIRTGKAAYQPEPGIEEDSYNLYMEGKLCGEQINTALTGSDTNSKDGQTVVGLRKRRNMRK